MHKACSGVQKNLLHVVLILPQVICCEGNAGFYEVGCMNTPLEGEGSCCTEMCFVCKVLG